MRVRSEEIVRQRLGPRPLEAEACLTVAEASIQCPPLTQGPAFTGPTIDGQGADLEVALKYQGFESRQTPGWTRQVRRRARGNRALLFLHNENTKEKAMATTNQLVRKPRHRKRSKARFRRWKAARRSVAFARASIQRRRRSRTRPCARLLVCV